MKTEEQEYEELAAKLHREIRPEKDEYIICAANWYRTLDVHVHQPINIEFGFVICGRRHHNCFITVSILNDSVRPVCEQGFLTSKDRWVNREEAAKIAFANGQIKKETKILFSEDIY